MSPTHDCPPFLGKMQAILVGEIRGRGGVGQEA